MIIFTLWRHHAAEARVLCYAAWQDSCNNDKITEVADTLGCSTHQLGRCGQAKSNEESSSYDDKAVQDMQA